MAVEIKTNFTSGQISKNIYGRGDLSIFENGARNLENVVIHPAGGVSRRYGTKYIDSHNNKCRLISFEFNTEQTYLMCFSEYELNIYRNDKCIATLETPWNETQIFEINWAQSADTLIVVHKDVRPKTIIRNDDEVWTIENMAFYKDSSSNVPYGPYYNFYNKSVSVGIEGYNIFYCGLRASKPIFHDGFIGKFIKINSGVVKVLSCSEPTGIYCQVHVTMPVLTSTANWEEEVFSEDRGWPSTVAFHQDRLVLGGSKTLPNHVWISKSSDIFNFNKGSGVDSDAMSFSILSDQVNAIKAVVSSRHLLVFTTGAEWMVGGEPLTPANITLRRQTTIGSYLKYNIQPQQIDGATVFISRNGRQLREFLYTDIEEAYQAKNLTLMSEGIINEPLDSAFDANSNILYIVQEDGSISCLTSYRTEQVNAWSKMKTQGSFISLCVIDDEIYFCVERNGKYCIERMDNNFFLDCCIELSSSDPCKEWEGFNHLEGHEVNVVADGFFAGKYTVTDGKINLLEEALKIYVGYGYDHVIEPLPYFANTGKVYPPKAYRMTQGIFRLIDTNSFNINLGGGYFSVPLRRISGTEILDSSPLNFSGDVQLRSLGWIRNMNDCAWSIKSNEPSSFTLLSVLSEIKTKE